MKDKIFFMGDRSSDPVDVAAHAALALADLRCVLDFHLSEELVGQFISSGFEPPIPVDFSDPVHRDLGHARVDSYLSLGANASPREATKISLEFLALARLH